MSEEKLIYREVPFYTQTKMIELLKDKNIEKDDILDIILCVSMNEISFKFAEKVCRKFIKSGDLDIKKLVIISVGHIARVYRKLVHIKIINELIKTYDEKHPEFMIVLKSLLMISKNS